MHGINRKGIVTGVLLLWLLSYATPVFPQPKSNKQFTKESETTLRKDANEAFSYGDYNTALDGYLALYKATKTAANHYKIGYCYLHTTKDVKSKAVPFLEYVIEHTEQPPAEAYFYLGLALHHAHKFDDALKYYNKYIDVTKGKPDTKLEVQRQIEMCLTAKKMVKHPINARFINLGKELNSPYADYNPFISADETELIFTSRRKGTTGGMIDEIGFYAADIFISQLKDGKWTKAKNMGFIINTDGDEETLGLSADGQKLFIYIDNMDYYGDVFVSNHKGKSWTKPERLGENVNTKEPETGATLSPAGNKIIFVSERKGGLGGKDLYMSKILPNGTWGLPVNLGPALNTIYDEDAPYLFSDGNTLYFSSKGHESMGGFDIFKTVWSEEKQEWSKPENIGYPINTTDDDLYFTLSSSGRYAYISAVREEGIGDLDIYKVVFSDVISNVNYTLLKGIVTTDNSIIPQNLQISLTDKNTGEIAGLYTPNATTGKFIMILAPGVYILSIEQEGYQPITEELTIQEVNKITEVQKVITLQKR